MDIDFGEVREVSEVVEGSGEVVGNSGWAQLYCDVCCCWNRKVTKQERRLVLSIGTEVLQAWWWYQSSVSSIIYRVHEVEFHFAEVRSALQEVKYPCGRTIVRRPVTKLHDTKLDISLHGNSVHARRNCNSRREDRSAPKSVGDGAVLT